MADFLSSDSFAVNYNSFQSKDVIALSTIKGRSYAYHSCENEDELEHVRKNREELLKMCDFDSLITLKQVHSSIIHSIDSENVSKYNQNSVIEGDGLITNLPGILIGVLTADCVPLLYTERTEGMPRFVAAVHAGWRGVDGMIHKKVLDIIKSEYDVPTGNVEVLIGPHIRRCSYEVGPELIERFRAKYPGLDFYGKVDGSYYLSLGAIIRHDLIDAGVNKKSISDSGFDTYARKNSGPEFYSYRKGDKSGRILNGIGIKKNEKKVDNL